MGDKRIAPEVVRYTDRPLPANDPGIDTLSMEQLRRHASARHLTAYQRLEFFIFQLYTAGRGFHTVNFNRLAVEPGTLIVVKPGDVHRFDLNQSLDGRLLVARPEMVATEYLMPRGQITPRHWPSRVRLSPSMANEFLLICDQVHADIFRSAPQPLRVSLARVRLNSWLLLLQMACEEDSPPAADASKAQELVAAFESLLEQHFKDHWSIIDYAKKLGYSERTLTRACLSCRGLTAKCIRDARTLLEIKRCLVHRNDSLAAIAYRLKFPHVSGMIQFFKRLEGVSPTAFRHSARERM